MNISNIRTRVEPLNNRSSLGTGTREQEETAILTLVDNAEGNDLESSGTLDPLIQALVDKLPKPNTIWTIDDRGSWLKAAAMAFNLVYRSPASQEIKQPDMKAAG
jgi:hypothetical protein